LILICLGRFNAYKIGRQANLIRFHSLKENPRSTNAGIFLDIPMEKLTNNQQFKEKN
jgi:hypothetical protein